MSPILLFRKTTRVWLRGIVATAINGFASGLILLIADPVAFNFDAGFKKMLATSGIFALIGLANYLKQHPLPDDDDVVVLTDRITNQEKP